MLKKTVTYKDFDENQRTEDAYFNLTEAEIVELETEFPGGLSGIIEKISKTNDQAELIKIFKILIVKSYGVKSEDGRKFVKNDLLREDFVSSALYSKIFMELATDDKAAADFFEHVIPKIEA